MYHFISASGTSQRTCCGQCRTLINAHLNLIPQNRPLPMPRTGEQRVVVGVSHFHAHASSQAPRHGAHHDSPCAGPRRPWRSTANCCQHRPTDPRHRCCDPKLSACEYPNEDRDGAETIYRVRPTAAPQFWCGRQILRGHSQIAAGGTRAGFTNITMNEIVCKG
jgi:hypothetical protein